MAPISTVWKLLMWFRRGALRGILGIFNQLYNDSIIHHSMSGMTMLDDGFDYRTLCLLTITINKYITHTHLFIDNLYSNFGPLFCQEHLIWLKLMARSRYQTNQLWLVNQSFKEQTTINGTLNTNNHRLRSVLCATTKKKLCAWGGSSSTCP